MAYRFVRADPRWDRLPALRERLDAGEIDAMQPFGRSTTTALDNARYDPDEGVAVWVQEDYCSPPLAQERAAVLDEYFESIDVVEENVDETAGWNRIEALPSLWDHVEAAA